MAKFLPKKCKSELKLHILLLDSFTFTFLVGILPFSTQLWGRNQLKKSPCIFQTLLCGEFSWSRIVTVSTSSIPPTYSLKTILEFLTRKQIVLLNDKKLNDKCGKILCWNPSLSFSVKEHRSGDNLEEIQLEIKLVAIQLCRLFWLDPGRNGHNIWFASKTSSKDMTFDFLLQEYNILSCQLAFGTGSFQMHFWKI